MNTNLIKYLLEFSIVLVLPFTIVTTKRLNAFGLKTPLLSVIYLPKCVYVIGLEDQPKKRVLELRGGFSEVSGFFVMTRVKFSIKIAKTEIMNALECKRVLIIIMLYFSVTGLVTKSYKILVANLLIKVYT